MNRRKHIFLFFLSLSLFMLSGCHSEEMESNSTGRLIFTGRVYQASSPSTRTPEEGTLYRDDFPTIFYLASKVGATKKCSTYLIPEQQPGVLRSYATRDSIVWTSKNEAHVFYGWTMPWKETDSYKDNLEDETPVSFIENHEMYKDVEDNRYCKVLETFVGAKAGPLTYYDTGEYVNLQFKHLVSKIFIGNIRFSFLDEDGSMKNKNVTGEITLYNMPSEGIFVRESPDGPKVVANPEKPMEMTYEIRPGLCFYVCPDVDYSNVQFRIKSVDIDTGEFMGDFSSIYLERNPEDWWDQSYNDPHVLYAGEMMTVNITLRQGVGVLFSTSISAWNDQPVRNGYAYPTLGLYEANELQYFYEFFRNGYTDEEEERLCSIYGDPAIHEFRLYNDIEDLVHGVRIGRNHVLNGMGHTLTFKDPYKDTVSGNLLVRVRVSRMKDVYIEDTEGHKIYINENFEIMLVDKDGNMTPTGNRLEDLVDGENAYTINLVTGAVSKTDSY